LQAIKITGIFMLKKSLFVFACLFSSAFATEAIIVGIAGGTGSGKTTLAKKLQEAFPHESILISQDSYYKDLSGLTLEERERVNFDHPDSLDFVLLKSQIEQLKNCEGIQKPVYNFKTHTREKFSHTVQPSKLVIVEGILLFAIPEMRHLFNIKVFIDTDDDVRILRRIERDIQERARDFNSVRDQYLLTVKPMHEAFVEPSKQYADLIVPRGGENLMALSVLISKLKEELVRKEQFSCLP
jgi:uridine kinase